MAITDERSSRNSRISYSDYKQLNEIGKIDFNDTKIVNLFGREIRTYKDVQLNHIHIKLNSACNANCKFCIERGNERISCKANLYLERLETILKEFKDNKILYSVSITGGEPTLDKNFFPVLDLLKKYNVSLITINTNGSRLLELASKLSQYNIVSINISRHHYRDKINKEIFNSDKVPTKSELKKIVKIYHKLNNKTLIRLQCICQQVGINSPKEIEKFKRKMKFADDFSFRELMEVDNTYTCLNQKSKYISLDKTIDSYFKDSVRYEFRYQRIVDYYVYEGYFDKKLNKLVMFSFSNMKDLNNQERKEETTDFNMYREFIYFQDGIFTGSWSGVRKVLLPKI